LAAHDRADPAAVVAMLRAAVRFTMPPQPVRYDGRDAVASRYHGVRSTGWLATGLLIACGLLIVRVSRRPSGNFPVRPADSLVAAVCAT
jgi:hypothetical protein